MNFPLDNPLFQLFYWLIDTAGIGGIAAILVGVGSVSMYAITFYWIYLGSKEDDPDTYSFPTTALFHDHED